MLRKLNRKKGMQNAAQTLLGLKLNSEGFVALLYSFECMAWIMKFMLSKGKEILLGELEGSMLLLPHSFHLKGSEYLFQKFHSSSSGACMQESSQH
jgi:hypothetical protein